VVVRFHRQRDAIAVIDVFDAFGVVPIALTGPLPDFQSDIAAREELPEGPGLELLVSGS
jgi:hypothetical protein